MSPRPKTGIGPTIEEAITAAIAVLRKDPAQQRTAMNLATLAGISRATLYRAFDERPALREAFDCLSIADSVEAKERGEVDRRVAELRAENADLRQLVAALTTVVEALQRDNVGLRAQVKDRPTGLASLPMAETSGG